MKFRRRNYVTNKKYQFRMFGILLVVILLATILSTFVTHYFILSSIVEFTSKEGRPPTGMELIVASIKPIAITLPIIIVILCVLVLFISHRIAGPLHRLKVYMKKVGEGDFSIKLQFRKSDAIHDVADSFNEMVENLKKMK